MFDVRIDMPDERRFIARFEQLPTALRAQLLTAITRLTATLLSRVLAAEPQRSGKLRAFTRSFVDQNENFVRGRVRVLGQGGAGGGHNIAAAALEYGAHSVVHVGASERNGAFVAAYTRRANITGMSFLRNAELSIVPEATAAIEQSVGHAIQGIVA